VKGQVEGDERESEVEVRGHVGVNVRFNMRGGLKYVNLRLR